MASFKYEHNYKNTGKLMKSDELGDYLEGIARDMKLRCGEGYETDQYQAGQRVIASCYTATEEAYQDDRKNNTLLKAMR